MAVNSRIKATKSKLNKSLSAPIVISVGGSLVVPELIDTQFLTNFKKTIDENVSKGVRFIIICGGGKTARNYQKAGQNITTLGSKEIDWLGIHATRLNSQLLKTIFAPNVEEVIVHNPNEEIRYKKPILIAAGWKPGWSTDYIAVLLAKRFGAVKMINLSNIDCVYDKDPKKYFDARPIMNISWKDFRAIIPKKWDPGLSSPFDPIASREAEKQGIQVAIINGENPGQLENFIHDKSFDGTLIS